VIVLTQHVVLVEPNYYSPFPPIGLLKLSSYEKSKGNTTELVRKRGFPRRKPDKIYITSLFTWAWRPVWEAVRSFKAWFPNVEITLGGLYASLMPEHAALSGADHIWVGLFEEAEDMVPDYTLVPRWKASIVFASRGCCRACPYCSVPKIEGRMNRQKRSIRRYIWPGHTKIIFFDNNILASQYWCQIFQEVIDLGMAVDFNQGLDARLLSPEAAALISKMKIRTVRLAYDTPSQKEAVESAIELLHSQGVRKRRIQVYTLFNFRETPDEFLERVRQILEWGAVCYPMRYQPPMTLKKDSFVSAHWTRDQLEKVAKARRVIGYGGAFPPYKGLIEKFRSASGFDDAFELFPPKEPLSGIGFLSRKADSARQTDLLKW